MTPSYPLHQAVKNRDGAGLRQLLIAQYADVGARTPDGLTALHWAAQEGYVDIARLLLSAGANANADGPGGTTPLFSALVAPVDRQAATVCLLIDCGADIRSCLTSGYSFLRLAREMGAPPLIRALRDRGLLR